MSLLIRNRLHSTTYAACTACPAEPRYILLCPISHNSHSSLSIGSAKDRNVAIMSFVWRTGAPRQNSLSLACGTRPAYRHHVPHTFFGITERSAQSARRVETCGCELSSTRGAIATMCFAVQMRYHVNVDTTDHIRSHPACDHAQYLSTNKNFPTVTPGNCCVYHVSRQGENKYRDRVVK